MGQKNSQLSPKLLEDLSLVTQFSQDEIMNFYRDFLTKYPNGIITAKDLKRVYKQAYPDGDPDDLIKEMLRVYDANNSGELDFREFLSGLCVMAYGSLENKLKLAFDLFDLDHSGWISHKELESLIKAIYKAKGHPEDADRQCKFIFESLDKNNDNRISLQEFINAAKLDSSIIRVLETSQILKGD